MHVFQTLGTDKSTSMPPPLVVANWKMHGDKPTVKAWLDTVNVPSNVTPVLCLPSPLIDYAHECLGHCARKDRFFLGAQDCHFETKGPFTGFTSPKLLQELGCSYVIIGHSERRHMESCQDIQLKAKAIQQQHMYPVICVGDTHDAHTKGQSVDEVCAQIKDICRDLDAPFYLAYEPLWAIGSGLIPSLQHIENMHSAMYHTLQEVGAREMCCGILYGGSVTEDNAASVINCALVSGLLVGGASLNAAAFQRILETAHKRTL